MNRTMRRFFIIGVGWSAGSLAMWIVQVTLLGYPIRTWYTVPISIAIGLGLCLAVYVLIIRRQEQKRIGRYLIDLRLYKRKPILPPSDIPWHVQGLTQRDVHRLVENRHKAQQIYYRSQEKWHARKEEVRS